FVTKPSFIVGQLANHRCELRERDCTNLLRPDSVTPFDASQNPPHNCCFGRVIFAQIAVAHRNRRKAPTQAADFEETRVLSKVLCNLLRATRCSSTPSYEVPKIRLISAAGICSMAGSQVVLD